MSFPSPPPHKVQPDDETLEYDGFNCERMIDDLSDNEDELLQPVLPVSRKPIIRPSRPPATGEEYLRM
ncbi:13040_t:CDS:1, partial [Acaulospora morrowiae]